MMQYQGRGVLAKTPVLSKDGDFLFEVDHAGFMHLAERALVKMHGTPRKIHRLQLTIDVAQADINELDRDPRLGKKMTRAEHVGERWYIHQFKHIPSFLERDFKAVRLSVMAILPAHLADGC